MNARTELRHLLNELEQLDREYEFAKSRAIYHYDAALTGDMTATMMYYGARGRMEEIERRVIVIGDRIADLKQMIKHNVGGCNDRYN